MKAIKYPKIGQLKDVVHEIRRRASFDGLDEQGQPKYKPAYNLPTLTFEGTVKLHGSNSSVVIGKDEIRFQSRNKVITPENDNYGFARWASDIDWRKVISNVNYDGDNELIILYGEWCGQGVQSGVAISEMKTRFVIFSIRVIDINKYKNDEESESGSEWLRSKDIKKLITKDLDSVDIINSVDTWEIDIDFNQPQLLQNELIEITAKVESQCPYGKAYGFKGIGEGVVYKCMSPEFRSLMFKVKGEKHSKSKVKVLNKVDLDAMVAANALATEIMTVERMNGGIEYIKEQGLDINRRNLGPYLKYLVSDTIAEEKIKIEESGIDTKSLGKPLSEIAKNYFLQLETEINGGIEI